MKIDRKFLSKNQLVLAKEIIDICKTYYNVDFMVNSRRRVFVEPRQMAAALVREFCDVLTLYEITCLFGKKQHATIIHAIESVETKVDLYESFREDYFTLINIIEAQTDCKNLSYKKTRNKNRKINMLANKLQELKNSEIEELNEVINNYLKAIQWKQSSGVA